MNIWDIIVLQPMINVLIVLSNYLFGSFGLSIIILTVVIRLILLPLSLTQLKATRAMTTLQPRLMELQRKYARDRAKLAQEQMRMYRESGISPVGCMVPMLIQMPVWIALYQSIMLALAVNPEGLLNLSRYLYPWPVAFASLPLENKFLWLDMATGDTVLAILVGASMWVQQKMVTPHATDPRQAAQARMMLWMMPIMFTFFSLSFPSGLALYWVVSNIISIVMQYYVTGWGALALQRAGAGAGAETSRDRKLRRRIEVEGATKVQPKDTTSVPKEIPPVAPPPPPPSPPASQEKEEPEPKRSVWRFWK
ncbi:MAG: YidC/Oxa1 family membrane protein insertase [Dehalococcoidia bacterium]|nr:YidC/Oxa1 family membrane protein insertase [Dehalococcoidia bacterium]